LGISGRDADSPSRSKMTHLRPSSACASIQRHCDVRGTLPNPARGDLEQLHAGSRG
jgi:hypothetical protein